MTKFNLAILTFTITFFHLSCESKSKNGNQLNRGEYFSVTKVVDGDTFWVDNDTEKGLKIRLIGVDAPESQKSSKKEVGYFGKEANAYLKAMLLGKRVKLVRDVDSLDRYGRTLSYVYLEDGTFLNADLIKNGYAVVMTIPPNVKYAKLFFRLQIEARESKRGLWKGLNY